MALAEWRFSAQLAWKDLFIRWMTCVSAVVAILAGAYVLFKLIPVGIRSGVITLHYTIYLGIDDVRPWPWVFAIPLFLAAVLLINGSVACWIYRSDKLAARALSGLSCVIILLASLGAFFLVSINV